MLTQPNMNSQGEKAFFLCVMVITETDICQCNEKKDFWY